MTVNQTLLETTVIAYVAERVKRLVKSGALATVLAKLMADQPSEREARTALDRERRELEAKRDRLENALLDGTLAKDRAKVKLAELATGLERVDRDLHELRLVPKRTDLMKERDRLLKLAGDFGARIKAADPIVARQLIAQWLVKVVVHAPSGKGGPLPVDLTLRNVPAVGSPLAEVKRSAGATPALRVRGRRCSPAACPPSCRG